MTRIRSGSATQMEKHLNVLVIGDFPGYGPGLRGDQHFAEQFVQTARRRGQFITAELYTPASFGCLPSLLERLPLERYDWVVVQTGHDALHPSAMLTALRGFRPTLHRLLGALQPLADRVVLLTPFPHRQPLGSWLRRWGRRRLTGAAYRQGFAVFDTHAVVRSREEYYVTDSAEHLNAVSHELLGRGLYDFFLAHFDPRFPESISSKIH